MQPELERIVRQWLEKARRDLALARLAFEADPPLLDGVVYHCQQSAEKALKGFLTWHGRPFPRTHDLRDLIQLCLGVAGEFARIDAHADTLFPYAVAFRYPGVALEPGRDEAEEALRLAEEVYTFVLQRLPAVLHP